MKRRDFIAGLGGAAVLSVYGGAPARAQQPAAKPRRIAVLMGVREGDPEGVGRCAALIAGLKEHGWIDGSTAKLHVYWAGGSVARICEIVPGLVASSPDIIVSNGTAVTGQLHKATQTIPTVFNLTADPVGLGYIAPGVAQTSLLFNPGTAAFYLKFFEGQPGLGTLIKLAPVCDMAEYEAALGSIAAAQGSGVIIPADPFNSSNGAAIVKLVERFKLPAVCTYRQLALDGGLMAHGPATLPPSVRPPIMSTACCAAKSHRTFRRRRRPSISSCSISRPRRCRTSYFRKPCLRPPTR